METRMTQTYKDRLLKDINDIPVHILPRFYKIVHLLKTELVNDKTKPKNRNSLRGLWKGSEIDDRLIDEAKQSMFTYE